MNKTLKYVVFGVGGLLGLLVIAVVIVSLTFNPNDYKPLIVKMVKEKKQRTLNIEGDIKLAFFPKIGADLGKVSLSEHNNSVEFASVESAKVYLALMPLLKKQLVVDTIRIDGVHANIVRHKDGTTNFDDLLSKEEDSKQIKFDIDGVHVSNSGVNFTDEMANRKLSVSKLNLTTGHLALGTPTDVETDFNLDGDNPKVAVATHLKGNFLFDPTDKHFVAKGLVTDIKGNAAGLSDLAVNIKGDVDAKPQTMEFMVDGLNVTLNGQSNGAKLSVTLNAPKLSAEKDQVDGKEVHLDVSQEKGADVMQAKLILADLKGSPKAIQSSGITAEISGKQGARTITGKFASPFSGNLETLVFEIPKLAGNLDIQDPALPNGAMKGTFALKTHVDAKQEQVASDFNLDIDSTQLKGDVHVAGFATPHIKFNVNANQLDLTKLLGKSTASESKAGSSKPADLSALKTLFIDGSVNIGSIVYDKYRISNLAFNVKADGEKLSVNPLSVKFDDSQIRGSVGISQFSKPLYTFDLDIDKLDADHYVNASPSTTASTPKEDKPLDLSALKALNADGSLRIGSLKFGKIQSSNIKIDLKADGEKLKLAPLSAKIDDSQVQANLGISRFNDPVYSFNLNIDKLDADRYITKNNDPTAKKSGDTPIDLSALKKLNASGEANIGWLKLANVKTSNVKVGLKAEGGVATIAPFAADLYQGSMNGQLKVDARNTPAITLKQEMKSIAIGPLLVDAINNDMLEGKGTLNVDVSTQGATVGALKKALAGTAAMVLADGAVKGIDIAGSIRDIKSKINILKSQSNVGADQKKRTDFSEMTASFKINNGIAHNDDLSMKAPLFRITGAGDIDIAAETINYTAKPTIVKSLKGQGGADLDALSGLTIPVKISGTFSDPKYAMDFASIGAALAKSNLLEKVGGSKGESVQKLLGGDKAGALEGLLGNKKSPPPETTTPAGTTTEPAPAAAESKPATPEDKVKKKLNKLLGF